MLIISARYRDVLLKIVSLYIETGQPVGSRTICKRFRLPFSPATVRNVMADLEEEGYLIQPHTSAGRLPTDKGLRFYIDHLFLSLDNTDNEDVATLIRYVKTRASRFEDIFSAVLDMLERKTGYTGFGVNFLKRLVISDVRLINIVSRKVLLAVSFTSGHVFHQIMDLDLSRDKLNQISTELTENFRGKTLKEVSQELSSGFNLCRDDVHFKLNAQIISLLDSSSEIRFHGISNMVSMVGKNVGKLKEILSLIEQKERFIDIFSDFLSNKSEVSVMLGSETRFRSLEPLGIVVGKYGSNTGELGIVGIVGPRKMNYSYMIPMVRKTSKALTFILGKTQGEMACRLG